MFIRTRFPRRQIRLSSHFLRAYKTYVVSSSADPPPISPLSEPPKEYKNPDRTPEATMSVPRADVQTLRPLPTARRRWCHHHSPPVLPLPRVDLYCIGGESNRPPATFMPSLDRNIKRGGRPPKARLVRFPFLFRRGLLVHSCAIMQ